MTKKRSKPNAAKRKSKTKKQQSDMTITDKIGLSIFCWIAIIILLQVSVMFLPKTAPSNFEASWTSNTQSTSTANHVTLLNINEINFGK